MAKVVESHLAILTDMDCSKMDCASHKNKLGILLIQVSERKFPGKNFIRFLHSEDDGENINYIHTSECKDIIMNKEFILVHTKNGSFFQFKRLT